LKAPAITGVTGMNVNISLKYRCKALVGEKLAREATDPAIKAAWSDIATEWHTLASRTALDVSHELELA
jgi:hypothetical protein